jgi:hypothetical protein
MNKKNLLTIAPIEILHLFMNETTHLFTDYTICSLADLLGGKKLLANYGGAIYKRSVLNAPNNRDYYTAIANKQNALNIEGEIELAEHLYADRYIADNGKKSVLSYHRADINLAPELRRNYLNVIPTYCKSVEYFDANMNLIDTEELRPYFKDKTSKKQTELGLVGENQINFRNIKLDSFENIHYRGSIYIVQK